MRNAKVNFMVALKLLFKHNFYGEIKVYEFTWRVLVVSKRTFCIEEFTGADLIALIKNELDDFILHKMLNSQLPHFSP